MSIVEPNLNRKFVKLACAETSQVSFSYDHPFLSVSWPLSIWLRPYYVAQWFQILKTSHKISSFDVISRVFPSKFHLLPYLEDGFSTQSLSNCYRHKYDQSISQIFFELISVGFFVFGPTVLWEPLSEVSSVVQAFRVCATRMRDLHLCCWYYILVT